MELLKTNLGRLRIIGLLEGVSFILLIGVGMPLKYYFESPEANQVLGMAHGVLFILYVLLVLFVQAEQKWTKTKTFLALIASILPFGTFVADFKLFR